MLIRVGTTKVTVNNAYAYRYPNGKLVLRIVVPQTSITHDALKTLIKDNTEDIVKINEEGSVVETFTGFHYTMTILDKEDIYEVEVECVSETERKLGDMQNTVATQEFTIDQLKQIIAEQQNVINTQVATMDEMLSATLPEMLGELQTAIDLQAVQIAEQSKVITAQSVALSDQQELINTQVTTTDELLITLPAMINDMIAEAVVKSEEITPEQEVTE